ncbi:hypothetical protein [Cyclobacterium plantarum]|uniref:Uncharacterized protein n=1 Tax=Cyclobacterium plantarum TaxID=2716263 RepID=A0ABX0HBN1_9BACT|nr:hypothetical protein [Cyclobacterium plantarum]NHE57601.1 hypothetical protein [Cyclobacterium plantarum]
MKRIEEIEGVTAFLMSSAAGWDIPQKDTVSISKPEKYILNPNSKSPQITLRQG